MVALRRGRVVPMLVAAVLVAGGARADVLVVDGAGGAAFTTVQAAVDAAVDGDVVIVREGLYDEVVAVPDVSLVLCVAAGEEAVVRGLVVDGLSASRSLVVRGLDVQPGVVGSQAALHVHDAEGVVRIDHCTFDGGEGLPGDPAARDGGAAVCVLRCDSLALLRCVLRGGRGASLPAGGTGLPGAGGPGLHADEARVALTDGIVFGGHGGAVLAALDAAGGTGGDGLLNTGAELWVSASILEGGDGGWASCAPGGACGSGGPGGHAAHQTGVGAVLVLAGNLPHPGLGGAGGDGTPAPDGQPVHAPAGRVNDHGGPARRLSTDSPVVAGQALSVTLEGAAGDLMSLWVALLPGHHPVSSAAGVYLLEHALAISPLLIGAVPPGGGALDSDWTTPPLPPGIDAVTLHLQQVATPPGDVALGSAAVVTLLATSPTD